MKFLLLALLCISRFNYGQTAGQQELQYEKLVSDYFAEMRGGKENKTFPFSADEPLKISCLARYLNDTSQIVSLKSSKLLVEAGLKSSDPLLRMKSARLLIVSLKMEDRKTPVVISFLKRFRREDFDTTSKDSLISFLNHGYPDRDRLLKLIGFAGDGEDLDKIRKFSKPGNPSSTRWSAMLAMARLGHANALHDLIHQASKIKVDDKAVDQLLPDLIYTRQKEALDFAGDALLSDDLNCHSANNDRPGLISCVSLIMKLLCPAIKDFPQTPNASGDIKTNDYKESLAIVRKWFQTNRDSYRINNSTY